MELLDVVVLDGELIEPICRRNPVPPWVVHGSSHIERFDQDEWSWSMVEDRSWRVSSSNWWRFYINNMSPGGKILVMSS